MLSLLFSSFCYTPRHLFCFLPPFSFLFDVFVHLHIESREIDSFVVPRLGASSIEVGLLCLSCDTAKIRLLSILTKPFCLYSSDCREAALAPGRQVPMVLIRTASSRRSPWPLFGIGLGTADAPTGAKKIFAWLSPIFKDFSRRKRSRAIEEVKARRREKKQRYDIL